MPVTRRHLPVPVDARVREPDGERRADRRGLRAAHHAAAAQRAGEREQRPRRRTPSSSAKPTSPSSASVCERQRVRVADLLVDVARAHPAHLEGARPLAVQRLRPRTRRARRGSVSLRELFVDVSRAVPASARSGAVGRHEVLPVARDLSRQPVVPRPSPAPSRTTERLRRRQARPRHRPAPSARTARARDRRAHARRDPRRGGEPLRRRLRARRSPAARIVNASPWASCAAALRETSTSAA